MAITAANIQTWEEHNQALSKSVSKPVPPPASPRLTDIPRIVKKSDTQQQLPKNHLFNKLKSFIIEETEEKASIRQPNMKDAFYKRSKYLEDLTRKGE